MKSAKYVMKKSQNGNNHVLFVRGNSCSQNFAYLECFPGKCMTFSQQLLYKNRQQNGGSCN